MEDCKKLTPRHLMRTPCGGRHLDPRECTSPLPSPRETPARSEPPAVLAAATANRETCVAEPLVHLRVATALAASAAYSHRLAVVDGLLHRHSRS